jgi:hypothetical protein
MKQLVIVAAFAAVVATAVVVVNAGDESAPGGETVEAVAPRSQPDAPLFDPTGVAAAIASTSTFEIAPTEAAGSTPAASAVAAAIGSAPDRPGSSPSDAGSSKPGANKPSAASSPTSTSPQNGPTRTTTTVAKPPPSPTTTATTVQPTAPRPAPPRVPHHYTYSKDTVVTSTMTLRAGDTVTLRNGACLCFGPGGNADWQGSPTFTWSDDGREQNLKRNIKITGSGHIRFEHGSTASTIKFVEIDLRPPLEVSKYPLHWHHVGNGSRGTLVQGVVIKNSPNRAFVPHASHGITFRDTIAKNVAGSGYWWDPPPYQSTSQDQNSNDVTYEHALVDGVVPRSGEAGHRLMGFALSAGVGNKVLDSVAMNVDGGKDAAGFQWPEAHRTQPHSWVFRNNVAHHNSANGIFVWSNNSQEQIIRGYRGYSNGSADIDHGAYTNVYHYRDMRAGRLEVHAVGWSVRGGLVETVIAKRHRLDGGPVTFTQVIVGRLVIDNASSGGIKKPGHYVFTNTGLTWDRVTVNSAVPGTTVTIDGKKRTF